MSGSQGREVRGWEAPVTVAELVNGGPLAGARMYGSGEHPVHQVRIVDDLSVFSSVAPHTAVVLIGAAASGGWAVEMAMRRAWEQAAACVIAPAEAAGTGSSMGSSAVLAERLGITLIVVAADPLVTAVEVASAAARPSAARTQLVARCATRLAEAGASARRVLGVLNAELPGTSVAFVDPYGTRLAGRAAALAPAGQGPWPVEVEVTGPEGTALGRLVAAGPARSAGWPAVVRAVLDLAVAPLTAWAAAERLAASSDFALQSALADRLLAESAITGAEGAPAVTEAATTATGTQAALTGAEGVPTGSDAATTATGTEAATGVTGTEAALTGIGSVATGAEEVSPRPDEQGAGGVRQEATGRAGASPTGAGPGRGIRKGESGAIRKGESPGGAWPAGESPGGAWSTGAGRGGAFQGGAGRGGAVSGDAVRGDAGRGDAGRGGAFHAGTGRGGAVRGGAGRGGEGQQEPAGEGVWARAVALGWAVRGPMAAFMIRPSGRAPGPGDAERARAVIVATVGQVPVVARSEGWAGWSALPPEHLAERLGRAVQALPWPCAAGVGTPVADLRAMGESLLGAEAAAFLARAGSVARADRMGPAELLAAIPASALMAPATVVLQPLLAMDRDGTLLETLGAVLGEGGAVRAAERLGVHRNTVTARLDRIREAGYDLDDRATRLALQLACHVLGSTAPPPGPAT
ncbi:helix-turn-helix domain-containing protein [Nonomuraea sp. NPDC003804]|uniref:PucR family transcriptional regulator n=1 Tax=Nonomuraea sp. NPDC003804 TaxID=3154547 RepID=UPI0033AD0DD7